MIPYGRQNVNREDIDAVVNVLQSDWLTTGPTVEEFERALEAVAGGNPVVAVSSGTAALHTAYAAAGLGPGDELITPPITFVATQATAVALGATVTFADVCADTANLDPAAVEAAISPRTKAIVAVDFGGHPADMDALRAIADRHGLLLIADAAHSLGSTYEGRPVGSLADITVFSFYPTKNITTAEGGALTAKDPELLAKARSYCRQGLVRDPARHVMSGEGPWHQEVHTFGLNYRLPDVLAALGLSQLRRLGEFKSKRSVIKRQYDELLAGEPGIDIPVERGNVDPNWHLYPLRVERAKRRSVFEKLRRDGFGVQVNYMPAYWHPAFDRDRYPRGLCPVAEDFYAREISLPMFVGLGSSEVDRIAASVISAHTT
ncbi:DegT/DnrJ/EryC1/StrS family aminotransferase [bacterium]|nr:DegT/DnrJ/EryC1/StrS family aminotransferase [bacterium]